MIMLIGPILLPSLIHTHCHVMESALLSDSGSGQVTYSRYWNVSRHDVSIVLEKCLHISAYAIALCYRHEKGHDWVSLLEDELCGAEPHHPRKY